MDITNVTVNATNEEKLNTLYSAMCNGLGQLAGFGMGYTVDENSYNLARERLVVKWTADAKDTSRICYEDVLTEMLAGGGTIEISDEEGDGGVIGALNVVNLLKNWDKVPPRIILAFIDETDDAWTAVDFIQSIALGEIIYG